VNKPEPWTRGQQAHVAVNLADVLEATPVGPLALGNDQVAQLFLDDLVSRLAQIGRVVRVVGRQFFDHAVDEERQTGLAACLVRVLQTGPQVGGEVRPDLLNDLGVVLVDRHVALGLLAFALSLPERGTASG
jgi:hypothetical protein